MNVNGQPYRSISRDGHSLLVIDQTALPHAFRQKRLGTLADIADAIRHMVVRGAPLIGITAAYGLALALREDPSDTGLQTASDTLLATRPTAVNLQWALQQIRDHVHRLPVRERAQAALTHADALAEADIRHNAAIGEHGARLLRYRWELLGKPPVLNILTHCNAG